MFFPLRTMTETLSTLYRELTGHAPADVKALTPAGSNRRYYRLSTEGKEALVGVEGTSAVENKAFIAIARQLRSKGVSVPEVRACSADGLCYLQEDLGDTSLFTLIDPRLPADSEEHQLGEQMLREAMRQLPAIQFGGADGFDFEVCYPLPAMDRRSIMWDLNYFKYCFLKNTVLDFSEPALEDDFERLCDILLSEPYDTFMYRDFQSRNVMVHEGKPWFIDFQGGRRGPVYYDVASFLWQARAQLSDAKKEELIDVYLEALQRWRKTDGSAFRKTLRYFVLFRQLQVLGAYGFRGWMEHKAHFVESIPFAIEALSHELEQGFAELPYLDELLRTMTALPRFRRETPPEGLTVQISSFSFKRGIPEDKSTNGGGFVFDCRAVTNPGRYEEYRAFTGKDACVREFLDSEPDMQAFLTNVYALVDQAVERYLQRGFTHLMVSFGCTGGQHRSVYAAEHLAQHLKEKYEQIHIDLLHREQDNKEV